MREKRKDPPNGEVALGLEETALEHPFACIKRAEMLAQIKDAVHNGANLILLTGEEGSGKTVLCRLLEHEMAASCTTVFFSQAVDSFADVVLSIAMQLGLEVETVGEDGDPAFAVEQISDFLLSESLELLLIFDEAENIYLAILERIRTMLDEIISSGARMHILFSGRKTLLENYEQISSGDFPDTVEQHFDLAPLSYAETVDYLRNLAVWHPDIDALKVFSDAVVEEIYAHARGNLSLTNSLGQEALKSPDEDTSFMVLLNGVKEGVDGIGDHPVFMRSSDMFKKMTGYLPWAGVAVCCFLLLLFLFGRGKDEGDVNQLADLPEKEETAVVVQNETMQLPAKAEVKQEDSPAPELPLEENAAMGPEEEASEETAALATTAETSVEQDTDPVQNVLDQSATETDTEDGIQETVAAAGGTTAQETTGNEAVTAAEGQGAETGLPEEGGGVERLVRGDKIKKKEKLSSPPREKVGQQLAQSSNASNKAELLYEARLAAGSRWFTRKKDAMYTVQLMALTSSSAEQNIKNMLGQVAYRQQSGNFYILRKGTTPKGIFVFYGEYPSFERARLAQDSLPQFLRDHKPYVLSIKGAIDKATR